MINNIETQQSTRIIGTLAIQPTNIEAEVENDFINETLAKM